MLVCGQWLKWHALSLMLLGQQCLTKMQKAPTSIEQVFAQLFWELHKIALRTTCYLTLKTSPLSVLPSTLNLEVVVIQANNSNVCKANNLACRRWYTNVARNEPEGASTLKVNCIHLIMPGRAFWEASRDVPPCGIVRNAQGGRGRLCLGRGLGECAWGVGHATF
jgi:hypothetical protein